MVAPSTVIVGIAVPDTRPVFLAVLFVHVVSGCAAVITGAGAAVAHKGPGTHPRRGRAYLWSLTSVFGTAVALVVLRWPHNLHLLALGLIAFTAGLAGYRARRRRRPGWARRHLVAMGVSYVTLLTAFYVDNGPQLPVWELLPAWMFWILPTAAGGPVVARAFAGHGPRRE